MQLGMNYVTTYFLHAGGSRILRCWSMASTDLFRRDSGLVNEYARRRSRAQTFPPLVILHFAAMNS